MSEQNQQWEYRVQTFGTFFYAAKPQDIEGVLTEWGLEGWEVVSSYIIENTNKVNIIAKRPLSAQTRRWRSMPHTITS